MPKRTLSRRIALASATAFLAVPRVPAWAHGATRQKVVKSIEIGAPPEKVWAAVANVHDMSWDPDVVKTEGDGGNAVDAVRTMTLKNGGQLSDTITEYDAAGMTYATFLPHNDVKVLAVTNFSTNLKVVPADGGKSTVTWRLAGYRGDPNADPPPALDDAAAVAAMTAFATTGLEGLKKKVESAGA